MTKPDALVSRVLKARYYPDCHLLQACRRGGSSYTWSGLWEAKEVMKQGLRWVLGDGNTIKIKTDKWLRNKDDFRVDQNNSLVNDNAKVCEFFKPGSKQWDDIKVRNYFNNDDAAAILGVRVPQVCMKDRIAWSHSFNGVYTVKTGYQCWYSNHYVDAGLQQSKG